MQQSSLRSYASSSLCSASSDAETSSISLTSGSEDQNALGPVVHLDPDDGLPKIISREERKRLANLGPYQRCLTHYPLHEHGCQKRSFQAK